MLLQRNNTPKGWHCSEALRIFRPFVRVVAVYTSCFLRMFFGFASVKSEEDPKNIRRKYDCNTATTRRHSKNRSKRFRKKDAWISAASL
jgi:hypothetical protein